MVHEGRGHALSSADCVGGLEISQRVYVQAGWAPQVIKTEKKQLFQPRPARRPGFSLRMSRLEDCDTITEHVGILIVLLEFY